MTKQSQLTWKEQRLNQFYIRRLDKIIGITATAIDFQQSERIMGNSLTHHVCAKNQRLIFWVDTTWDERIGLSLSPVQKQQLGLPIRMGGSGIISAGDIINAAYLGASVASAPVIKLLRGHCIPLDFITGAQQSSEALKEQLSPDDPLPASVVDLPTFLSREASHPQHQLSVLVHKAKLAKLLASSHTPRDQLHLAAVARPHAGSWLAALPVKQLGLKFDKNEFIALLRWWLGLSILLPEPCPEPKCTHSLDVWGDHAVMCPCGPSRIARHDAVNNVWAHCLKSAGFYVTKEVHCDPDSQRRSADTLVDCWLFGRQCAHDWVITHTLQKSALARASVDPATALADAEAFKRSYAK